MMDLSSSMVIFPAFQVYLELIQYEHYWHSVMEVETVYIHHALVTPHYDSVNGDTYGMTIDIYLPFLALSSYQTKPFRRSLVLCSSSLQYFERK